MDIKQATEMATKCVNELDELEHHIGALTQSICDLMNDTSKLTIHGANVGLVVSFSAFGKNQIVGGFGNKTGIENALEFLTKTIKEEVK